MRNTASSRWLVIAMSGGWLLSTSINVLASDNDLHGLMAICQAKIDEGEAETKRISERLARLRLRLSQGQATNAGPSETPVDRLVAAGEHDVGRSTESLKSAQKAYHEAQVAIQAQNEPAARTAIRDVLFAVATADHAATASSRALDTVEKHVFANDPTKKLHLDEDGLLAELRRVNARSQDAFMADGSELAKAWAIDAFEPNKHSPPTPSLPSDPGHGTDFFHVRNHLEPVGGIKLTLQDLSVASIDPAKEVLVLLGRKSAASGLDADLFWTAIRLAAQSDEFEPDFSIDPVDVTHWEKEWDHLGAYLAQTFKFDSEFRARALTATAWDGQDYQLNILDRLDPDLYKHLSSEFRIQEMLRFEPSWLRSTRLGEVLFRADIAIKELWLPVSVKGELSSRISVIPGAVRFHGGRHETEPGAYRFWFVPGSKLSATQTIIDLSQVRPVLKVVGTAGGKDLDRSVPPWAAAIRDDVNNRFELYAHAVPEWATLSEVFRAYVFGAWLKKHDTTSFDRLLSLAPEPEPPSSSLPQIITPFIVLEYQRTAGQETTVKTMATKGGIGFSRDQLTTAPIERNQTDRLTQQVSAARRDIPHAGVGEVVGAELSLGTGSDRGLPPSFVEPIHNPAVTELTLRERYGRERDRLASQAAFVPEGNITALHLLGIAAMCITLLVLTAPVRLRCVALPYGSDACAFCSRSADNVSDLGVRRCRRCRLVQTWINLAGTLIRGVILGLIISCAAVVQVRMLISIAIGLVVLVGATQLLQVIGRLPRWLTRMDVIALAASVIVILHWSAIADRLLSHLRVPAFIMGGRVDDAAVFRLIAVVDGFTSPLGAGLLSGAVGISFLVVALWVSFRILSLGLSGLFGIRPEECPRRNAIGATKTQQDHLLFLRVFQRLLNKAGLRHGGKHGL
jgi:hypothetical protein